MKKHHFFELRLLFFHKFILFYMKNRILYDRALIHSVYDIVGWCSRGTGLQEKIHGNAAVEPNTLTFGPEVKDKPKTA